MSCRHFLLCLYGTIVIGLILAGRLKELKVVYILTGNRNLQVIYIKIKFVSYAHFETSLLILILQFIME